MKKTLFIAIPVLLLLGFSGCYKTCEDPFAPNYTLKGTCIDLTTAIIGTYNGQLQDSVVGSHSITNSISIQITKVDDSHVLVASSGTTSFVGFSAAVSASYDGLAFSGYTFTVPSQSSNGLAVTGAGAYFGSPADGVYVTTGKQLTFNVLAGTQYESFTGTQ